MLQPEALTGVKLATMYRGKYGGGRVVTSALTCIRISEKGKGMC